MRILVVEDDRTTLDVVSRALKAEGHAVIGIDDGPAGAILAMRSAFDLIVLDRDLPNDDAMTALRHMRAAGLATPILFLTARDEAEDRAAGLNAGADDVLLKPFSLTELAARVHALARRVPQASENGAVFRIADLEIDTDRRIVRRAGQAIALPPREFRLLSYLAEHATYVVTRAMLLKNVWGLDGDHATKIVETHISRLRTKIDRDHDRPLIQTVRGAGYSLRRQD